jgi:two-component system response regulator FixJ
MADRRLIHIIDDEEAVRRSAGFMLKTSGFVVETWASGTAFLKEVRHASPGCILLDVRMPEMDGLEVQQALNERGVVDFIEKPFEKAVLLGAIDAAFARLEDKKGRADRESEAAVAIAALTPRERDVLDGLAQGLPNKTIAYDLGISPRTVEVHRANLMTKLAVRSLSDALRIAFAAGLGTGES